MLKSELTWDASQCISSIIMAFSAGIGERGDDLRFRNPQSPREESSFPPITSPLRSVGTQLAAHGSDARGQLHRRFTTNNIPTLSTPLSPIGQQRRQAAEPTEFMTAVSIGSSFRGDAWKVVGALAAF